jgi:peptide/nickel transport system substrate-binding protein
VLQRFWAVGCSCRASPARREEGGVSGDERFVENLVDDYLAQKVDRRAFFLRAGALGLSASAAASILAACGGGKSGSSSASTAATAATTAAANPSAIKKGGQLIEGYDRDFSKIDPVLTPWDDPTFVAIYEYTVIRDAKGAYQPSLFASWDVSSDLLTWTFKLRPNLVFHGGGVCDAAAVAACFNVFRDPNAGQNAIFWPSVKAVTAPDAATVVVAMKTPFTAFPETLATENSMPLDLATRKKLGDNYGVSGTDGTGPFTFGSYQPGTAVVVNRFDKYPGSGVPFVQNKGAAHLDSVKWVPIVQVGNRANEIETGTVNVVKNPAPQDVDRLMGNGDLVTTQFPALANWWLSPDCTRKDLGFDDVNVRQAISHAIDREGLAKSLYFGHATATYGPLASNVTWYDKGVEQFNQFDPEKAKSLLDAAGWTMGSGGVREKGGKKLSFEHLCDTGQPTTSPGIDQAIVPMLKDVGIDMRVKAVDDATFNTAVFGGKAGPASWSYEWLWSSPVDLLVYFHVVPTDASNGAIPAVKDACAAWQSAGSHDELAAAASKLQLSWAEMLPKIPVLTTYNVWVAQKKVMGYSPLQTMLYPLYNDVWINA